MLVQRLALVALALVVTLAAADAHARYSVELQRVTPLRLPPGPICTDLDGDGLCLEDGDCDDTNADVYPGAPEICDGLDDDCDGILPADEVDGDGDGFGICDGDCDDDDNRFYPGAPELCNGLDNDCDGQVAVWERDYDEDGYKNCKGDCDGLDPAIHPGATEVCNGVDDDCDGLVDEDVDLDGDGVNDCETPCSMLMDFDDDGAGAPIEAGQDLAEAYAGWGVHIAVYEQNGSDPAMGIAFDTSDPTGGDFDLGTPNEDFGGPGVGTGGEAGAAGQNDTARFNVLISAENTLDADLDGLIDEPDDDAYGAWFVLTFDDTTCVSALTLVDIEVGEAPMEIVLYDDSGAVLGTVHAGGLGNNSVEVVDIDTCGVWLMEVHTYGSGGLDDIDLCVGDGGAVGVAMPDGPRQGAPQIHHDRGRPDGLVWP